MDKLPEFAMNIITKPVVIEYLYNRSIREKKHNHGVIYTPDKISKIMFYDYPKNATSHQVGAFTLENETYFLSEFGEWFSDSANNVYSCVTLEKSALLNVKLLEYVISALPSLAALYNAVSENLNTAANNVHVSIY